MRSRRSVEESHGGEIGNRKGPGVRARHRCFGLDRPVLCIAGRDQARAPRHDGARRAAGRPPKVQPQPQTRPARMRDSAPASCGNNERWSAKRGACICAKGMKREGDACVADEPVTAVRDPNVVPPPPPSAAPTPEQVEAIARSQKCLAELGYYKGEVDGKRGKATWTAYWHFKHDHDLEGYSNLLDRAGAGEARGAVPAEGGRDRSARQCWPTRFISRRAKRRPTRQRPRKPTPGDADDVALASPDSDSEQSAAPEPTARLDLDCLPETLISVLRRAHGVGVAVKACERRLPADAERVWPRPSSTRCKSIAAWCGAAPACRSTAISRSTTCGASSARGMSRFAPTPAAAGGALRGRHHRRAQVLSAGARALSRAAAGGRRSRGGGGHHRQSQL